MSKFPIYLCSKYISARTKSWARSSDQGSASWSCSGVDIKKDRAPGWDLAGPGSPSLAQFYVVLKFKCWPLAQAVWLQREALTESLVLAQLSPHLLYGLAKNWLCLNFQNAKSLIARVTVGGNVFTLNSGITYKPLLSLTVWGQFWINKHLVRIKIMNLFVDPLNGNLPLKFDCFSDKVAPETVIAKKAKSFIFD